MVITVMTKQYVAYDFLWGCQPFISLIFVLFSQEIIFVSQSSYYDTELM